METAYYPFHVLGFADQDLVQVQGTDICNSDFGGHCCAPGMESRVYTFKEFPGTWLEHEGYCRYVWYPKEYAISKYLLFQRDDGGYLVVFDTRAERDCLVQFMIDRFPPDNSLYNWAIGLGSSYRYKGALCNLHLIGVYVC